MTQGVNSSARYGCCKHVRSSCAASWPCDAEGLRGYQCGAGGVSSECGSREEGSRLFRASVESLEYIYIFF